VPEVGCRGVNSIAKEMTVATIYVLTQENKKIYRKRSLHSKLEFIYYQISKILSFGKK
jgi:hypothetical protein